MKKLILLVAISAFACIAKVNAQLLPVSLGIKGGYNTSTMNGWDNKKSKSGFNAGLTLDIKLPASLAIYSGIEVTSKGVKTKDTDASLNATYLQIPIHLGYRFNAIPGLGLHFSFGPYFSQGIGGKYKMHEMKHDTFGDSGILKRSDWGLGVAVGARILGLAQVRAGYDFGLMNVNKKEVSIADFKPLEKVKNRTFYVSLGFNFF